MKERHESNDFELELELELELDVMNLMSLKSEVDSGWWIGTISGKSSLSKWRYIAQKKK